MNNLFTYRFAFLHKCLSFMVVFLFVIYTGYSATFTSSGSGDWSNSATWGGAGVPGAGDDVVISGWLHDVTVDIATAECNNLTLTMGGELIINANTVVVNGNLVGQQYDYKISFTSGGVLKVAGNIDLQTINEGQGFTSSTLGTLELIGTGVQTINISSTGHVIGTIKQSASNSNNFSITGTGSITCYTYDQNCNTNNLVNGDSQIIVGAGGTINTACFTPTITTSETTLSGFAYCAGSGPSTEQSYTVEAENLTDDITITAPANYEISESSGSEFTSTITLSESDGSVATTTIYVRLESGLPAGDYIAQTISHESADATTQNVTCNGTVNPITVAGSVSGGSGICPGSTSGELSLTGQTGSVVKWQSSTDDGFTWSDIEHTSTTYTSGNLDVETQFRAVVKSGECVAKNSSATTVTMLSSPTGGTVSGDSPVCSGETAELKLSGHSDAVQKWQKSTDGGSIWSDIEPVTTTTDYTTEALTQTTSYRAVVTNDNCTANSVSHTVTVNELPAISSHPSTSTQDACIGVAATQLSVTASGAGITYQWYKNSSESNSGGTAISGATSASYTPSTATVGTVYYYCVVSGTCSPAATSDVSGAVITREIPTATASSNSPLYANAILELNGGPSGMATYSWSGPNGFSISERNPSRSPITTSDAGTYTLTVTNEYGCTDDATVDVSISAATNFYYDGVGNIASESNWWTNANGTGSNPSNFSSDGQTFNILHTNTATPTIENEPWTVSGAGTKIVIGDGTNPTNFIIPDTYALTTSGSVVIDVKNAATLTITNATSPTIGSTASGSTVVYNGSGAQTVKTANYYNLTLDNTREEATITLESGTISVSNTFTVSGLGTLDSDYTISATDNTFIFDGTGDQDIPAFEFNNLHTELGGTKTLTGNVRISNNLRIGAISTLAASDKEITLSGSGSIVTLVGNFSCGTSTVKYTSASNVTIGALNYYNLNASGGDRTLQASNIIGIAGAFTPGAGTYTIDGSTVSFNGSVAQNMPAFTFNNLIINNTSTGVTMKGNVSVEGVLTLTDGEFTTNSKVLTITNTDANAVSNGSADSYITTSFKRHIAADLSAASGTYRFPLGTSGGYYGFDINTVTTGTTAPVVTVQLTVGNPSGTYDGTLTAISNAEYWDVSYTGNLTSAKVSLTKSTGIDSYNAIGHSETSDGEYTSIFGSVSGSSIINSQVTSFSSFQLATRSISTVSYVYDCSGDLHATSSWFKDDNSNSIYDSATETTNPADFTIDDATWIIPCSGAVTLTSDLNLSGFNTTLQINSSATLTVDDNVSLTLNGDLDLDGNIVTNEGSSLSIYGDADLASQSSIDNSGTLMLSKDFLIRGSSVINRAVGVIEIENADFTYEAYQVDWGKEPTQFVNYGYVEVTNGNFSVINELADTQGTKTYVEFINASGGYILVDNTLAPTKEVVFDNLYFHEDAVSFEPNSTFKVQGSDVDMEMFCVAASISGHIILEDGDLDVTTLYGAGGLDLTIDLVEGGIFMSDTDNSGDGIINIANSGGNMSFNVEGTVYAEGIVTGVNSGSNGIYVKDGGTMFIGDVGATLQGNTVFNLTVEGGGTLNYCGNKTATGDDIGIVEDGGTLNYAESYYTTQTPHSQSDFDVAGNEIALYETAEECLAAFNAGASGGDALLPITLTMLYAECGNGGIIIHWQTVSEENNSHFTLYRSYDGVNFEEIAVVLGAGNSNEIINYEYTDNPERDGLVYYTLEQTDFDGTTTKSKIIMIHTCQDKNKNIFRISPDEIVVDFVNPYEVNYVVITFVDGKIVYTRQYAGKERAVIPNRFARGVYVITNYTQSFITSQKFMN